MEFTCVSIKILLRRLQKQLVDCEWEGDASRVADLRRQIDMLKLKLELGETHECNF